MTEKGLSDTCRQGMNRVEKARGGGLIQGVQLSAVIEALKIKKGNKRGQGKGSRSGSEEAASRKINSVDFCSVQFTA